MNKQALNVVGPIYMAGHYYYAEGGGQESNPYPKGTEERIDFALEMHRLQVKELKLMINGE